MTQRGALCYNPSEHVCEIALPGCPDQKEQVCDEPSERTNVEPRPLVPRFEVYGTSPHAPFAVTVTFRATSTLCSSNPEVPLTPQQRAPVRKTFGPSSRASGRTGGHERLSR